MLADPLAPKKERTPAPMTTVLPLEHRALVALPLIHATADLVREYGVFIGTEIPNAGLAIPFYKGSVIEGHNLDFAYTGRAVIRTSQIHKRSSEITWLERHLHMTQLFVGLGDAPFVMVLGKPTHARGNALPNLGDVAAFRFPAGHGILLHRGTWHDFPMACAAPVTVLTASSEEVVEVLSTATVADELDGGDVLKIDVARRFGKRLEVQMP